MAGHSKWANIRVHKGAQDKKRAKIFTKLIREITISAQIGGGDATANPRLRTAIAKALSGNMTRDTIDRAIKRGTGEIAGGGIIEEILYEGYGPGGVAVMVFCTSDNRNRTASEVRHAFTKMGGNLGTDGSVGYLFTKQGMISFNKGAPEDKILEVALEAGADDVITEEDGSIDVITTPDAFGAVQEALTKVKLMPTSASVTQHAAVTVSLDKDKAEKLLRMIDMLEELDDVQDVYSNAEISDDILASLP